MNNKRTAIISTILVVVLAAGMFFGYQWYKKSQSIEGQKTIIVEVIADREDYKKQYDIKTEKNTLGEVLDEKKMMKTNDSGVTRFITGVDGIDADDAAQEWWGIDIDGVASVTGVDDTIVEDGKRYTIKLNVGW